MLSHMSNDKKRAPGGCLGYLGDDKLPSYIWIMINHCKDHYETTSIIWKVTVFFFRGSNVFGGANQKHGHCA